MYRNFYSVSKKFSPELKKMSLDYVTIHYLYFPEIKEVINRIGVIPYSRIKVDDEIKEYWLLGTLHSGRLSDFGGTCLTEKGETPLDCLLREVDEESDEILTQYIISALEEAYQRSVVENKETPQLHIWRWSNRNQRNKYEYLIFIEVEYEQLADINERFKGNQENVSLDWYDKDELLKTTLTSNYNTSIQKFMRRFGFNTPKSPRR